jgi:hypothetical protein
VPALYFKALVVLGIVLVPLIPTIIAYIVIKSRSGSSVTGTLFGLRIETTGAIASYIICVLVALFVFKNVFTTGTVPLHIAVDVVGDGDRVKKFLQDTEVKTRLKLSSDDSSTITVPHLDVNTNKNSLSAEMDVPADDIGRTFSVSISYSARALSVSPTTIKLQDPVNLTVDLGSAQTQNKWNALVDAYLVSFKENAKDLYTKEIIVLTHDSAQPVGSLPLHSYLGIASLVSLEVTARSQDRSNFPALAQQWSRDALNEISPDEYSTLFETRFREYQHSGDELAIRHFTNSDYNVPGQGVRFQRGRISLDDQRLIPTIGPVDGGISSDRGVLVCVESWRKTDDEARRKSVEISTGDTFERATDRVIFGLTTEPSFPLDTNSLRMQFKSNLLYPVPRLGDARLRKGINAAIVDINGLSSDDVLQIYWAWK